MEEPKSQGPAIPEELPLVPVMETVIYPLTVMPLAVAGKRFSEAVDEAMSKDRIIAIFGAREEEGVPADDAMFRVGTAGIIHKLIKLPDGGIRLIVQGLEKITVTEFTQKEPYPRGTVSVVKDDEEKTRNVEALLRTVEQTYQRILSLTPQVPEEVKIAAANIDEPLRLVYFIGTMLKLTLEERQELLELDNAEDKLRRLSFFLGEGA